MFSRLKRWWRWEGKYLHRDIKYGIQNLIRWFPIIWKDRDWDQAYIWDILERKLRNQSYYVKHYGHHVNTDYDSRNMLICANLIKKIRDEYYDMEYMDYFKWDAEFLPIENSKSYEMRLHTRWEKFDEYFKKYPLVYKKVVATIEPERKDDKKYIAMRIAQKNHRRAIRLLFKIMEDHIERWWD